MEYEKKRLFLICLIAVLGITYILTFVFSPENTRGRGASMALISEGAANDADYIEITNDGKSITLLKIEGGWVCKKDGRNYTVKPEKVEDLLAVLTKKAPYPVRSNNKGAAAKFGITDTSPSIKVKKADAVLLEVSFGNDDPSGKEVYLALSREEKVYSTQDKFAPYLNADTRNYLDLRLFPEHDKKNLTVDSIQRIRVNPIYGESYILSRGGDEWVCEGNKDKLDKQAVEAQIRFVLDLNGEDFVFPDDNAGIIEGAASTDTADFKEAGSFVLESADGNQWKVGVSEKNTSGKNADKYAASATGSNYLYVISEWVVTKLFKQEPTYLPST